MEQKLKEFNISDDEISQLFQMMWQKRLVSWLTPMGNISEPYNIRTLGTMLKSVSLIQSKNWVMDNML